MDSERNKIIFNDNDIDGNDINSSAPLPPLADPLYLWLYAVDTAEREHKTIEEVLRMTPELQTFAQEDAGFRQFCEQYKRVASDPKTRREYWNYCAQMTIDKTREEMIDAQGYLRAKLEDAKRALVFGLSPEQVAIMLDLPLADVMSLL